MGQPGRGPEDHQSGGTPAIVAAHFRGRKVEQGRLSGYVEEAPGVPDLIMTEIAESLGVNMDRGGRKGT
jgi:hypothetical protein